MKLAKIMLSITALVWIPYGLWLFFDPKGLSYSGLVIEHWSAIVEVQAMYGSAEVMLGLFALFGVLNPKKYMEPAVLLWFMIYSSLWITRVIAIIQWGGTFAIDFGPAGLPESYNPGALYFLELPSSILFGIALLKLRKEQQ